MDKFNTVPTSITKGWFPNFTTILKFVCKNKWGRTVKKMVRKKKNHEVELVLTDTKTYKVAFLK